MSNFQSYTMVASTTTLFIGRPVSQRNSNISQMGKNYSKYMIKLVKLSYGPRKIIIFDIQIDYKKCGLSNKFLRNLHFSFGPFGYNISPWIEHLQSISKLNAHFGSNMKTSHTSELQYPAIFGPPLVKNDQ